MSVKQKPQCIILDGDKAQFEVLQFLKNLRTPRDIKHVPFIILSDTADHANKVRYSELGASDYVKKTIELEDLELRMLNSMNGRDSIHISSITGLPSAIAVDAHIRKLLRKQITNWVYIEFDIHYFSSYCEQYNWQIQNEVIQSLVLIIAESSELNGTDKDFVSHTGRFSFSLVSYATNVQAMMIVIAEKFAQNVREFYSVEDLERSYMLIDDAYIPLMSIGFGICDVSELCDESSDMTTIVELAANDRRRRYPEYYNRNDEPPILTAW